MHAATAPPLAAAAVRLWLARALAWTLLMGGWLALGALGQQHLPRLAGGLAPLALWLLAIGLGLSWPGSARLIGSAKALRCTLLGAAAVTAGALLAVAGGRWPAGWLLLATLGWAALLLAASCSVRALRPLQRKPPPSPALPAVAGALLAWAWAGDSLALRASPAILAASILAAALLLAVLLPRALRSLTRCHAGLFDCSPPLLLAPHWHRLQAWPQAAAALSMLPMMLSLAVMADWCANLPGLRGGASLLTALHLAAMLGPALVLTLWASIRPPGRLADQTITLAMGTLLAAGGGALLVWPGLAGLMAASLLQGMAWSLAWAASLRRPGTAPAPASARGTNAAPLAAAWRAAALTAAAVLALGLAIDRHGPAALATVHAVLALAGGLGVLALLVARWPPAPATHTRQSPDGGDQRISSRQASPRRISR